MKRAVVGVMGHVDHGKTALVRALTGMETDRLVEEKRRGISIALGFAHLQAGAATIDLIDMPGHERFVRTMVSGATGIEAALLVVAANEGIKPQTVEHLDIAGLLGLRRVIVAVSKADLVSAEAVERVAAAAAALVAACGMEVSALVPTSVPAGRGLDGLRDALAAVVAAEQPADDGFAYLPIDRAFSVSGHGTVVTGTLRRGPLLLTDAVATVPDGRALRLRGLHVHGQKATQGWPGQRLAVNLRDISPEQIASGAALTARGLLAAGAWLTVALRSVERAPPLPTSTKLVLLFGTEEVEARLRLLDCDVLAPGGTALAQLRCARPVAVPARERFILRRISPPLTVAGGRVIDPAATRLRRHSPPLLARWGALAEAAPDAIVAAEIRVAEAHGVALSRLAQLAGLSEARTALLIAGLPAMLGRSRVVVAQAAWQRVLASVPAAVAGTDAEVSPERLAALLPWAGRAVLEDACAELVRGGAILRVGAAIRRRPARQEAARADEETLAAGRMTETLRRAGLSPPDIAVILPDAGAKRLADRLVRAGDLVRAIDRVQKRELLFHQDAIELAKRTLRPLLTGGAGLSVGEAGTALGISRKFCVPLLEHLDLIRFTRRVADRRVLASVE